MQGLIGFVLSLNVGHGYSFENMYASRGQPSMESIPLRSWLCGHIAALVRMRLIGEAARSSSGTSTNDKSSPGFDEISARCIQLRSGERPGQRAMKRLCLPERWRGCHRQWLMIKHCCFVRVHRPTRRSRGLSSGVTSCRLLASRSTLR